MSHVTVTTFCNYSLRCVHSLCFTSSRSSVCRMSSKDKITVQDQSKEKGVSGSLHFPEERESSFGNQPLSSPDEWNCCVLWKCLMLLIILLENCPESGPDAESECTPTECFFNEVQITQHPLLSLTSQSIKSEIKRWNNLKNLDCLFSEMFYENQILFKTKLFKCFEVLF